MNKSRRRRVTTSDNTAGASVYELYEIHGDAASALAASRPGEKRQEGSDEDYNRVLLSYMASESGGNTASSRESMVQQMEEWEKKFNQKDENNNKNLKARKRTRNEWIAAYNRALLLLANGDVTKSNVVCSEKLQAMVTGKKKASSEMSMVSTRMAFLFLETILANSLASHSGLCDFKCSLETKAVVEWLEIQEPESDPQFKFLLALYKSRMDFAERDDSGKHLDNKIRSARKELKTAMEVFQHKLRPPTSGEGESVASSAEADSEVHNISSNSQQENPSMSLVLQKQNQAALNLKANVEHLKGNPKKSLILLGEALAAAPDDPFYDAMHANNLTLVYESNDKKHLAMHTIGKALRVDLRKPNIQSDGTARPDPSLVTLYNSALCSLQARKFLSAYECMSVCVKHSSTFRQRPRCWLLMAESCIGIHAETRKNSSIGVFSSVEVKGEAKGLMIKNVANGSSKSPSINDGEICIKDQMEDELEEVKGYPLVRARTCLETCLHLLKEQGDKDSNALASTRLSLAYVSLELRDFSRALKMAKLVIEGCSPSTTSDSEQGKKEGKANRSQLRQLATARMYASEASCSMGDAQSAMRFLVGDGQGDAFDRLASELGGVTIEVAAKNPKGKSRLARAQAMVRSSASAASAVLGNHGPAKQLAMSAQAMEDAFSKSREGSTARRALVYCMLREGNHGAALSLLRSLT